ncbi:MAG: cytochrome C [Alphaproteobacteria bacterium]|nr:cytochrome C [Alphaproteobacteria bacterium]
MSFRTKQFSVIGVVAAVLALWSLASTPAWAVPAYSAKTDQPCAACHVGGFGPQLTPFGRQFKLHGYTMDAGDNKFPMPVSAEVVASYTSTAKAQESLPADHYATNDNFTMDHASIFVAGGIGDHFGYFSQWTYDGVGRAFSWDMLDVRLTDEFNVSGNDVLAGLTLTNMPANQDVWNTLPTWGFPYSTSDLAPAPAAGTMFDGALDMQVLGLSAYAYLNSNIYAEAGFYWTPSNGFLRAMGSSTMMGPGAISDVAPYFRLAYQKDYGDQNFEIGAFGFFPSIDPNGDMGPVHIGKTDNYSDIGVDASYQFMGDGNNIYTVNARYTHEDQSLDASYFLGNATSASNSLDDFRIDASYYWHNQIGGTIQLFDTTGSSDAMLYADNRTLAPDSSGITFQIDGTPWGVGNSPFDNRLNLRVGIQYTMYSKFDGASSNYDGTGRNAGDNNTLRIFTWLAL